MRHTFAYLLLIITAALTFLPGVFLAIQVSVFSFDQGGKKLTLTDATGAIHNINLLSSDPGYLSRFLNQEAKKEVTTTLAADFPLPPAQKYHLLPINGYAGTLGVSSSTAMREMKATSTYTKKAFTATDPVTAAATMDNTSKKLTFKMTAGDVTFDNIVISDFNTLSMGQTGFALVTGLAAGSHKISDGFDDNQYYIQVDANKTGQILVIHDAPGLLKRQFIKLRRSIIFITLYCLGVLLSTFIVKTIDPEIYLLGGGISGAIFGFDGAEETVLDDSATDVPSSGGSEDLSSGPIRTDRSRPNSSEVTSSPTSPRTDEAAYGENDISDESQEKADAHSAPCALLIAAIASLLL